MPLPVPYMMLTFTLGGVLNPALVGASAGLGLSVGGITLYLTGRGGRLVFTQFNLSNPVDDAYSSRIARFLRWIKLPQVIDFSHRRGVVAIFVLSAIPNPFYTPMAISMGTMRFRFMNFFFACWAGNTIKGMALAYFGYLGLGSILHWLGFSA